MKINLTLVILVGIIIGSTFLSGTFSTPKKILRPKKFAILANTAPGSGGVAGQPVGSAKTLQLGVLPLITVTPGPTNSPNYGNIYNIDCLHNNLTPDGLCQLNGYTHAKLVRGSIVAKGYWWGECAGASVGNCNGIDCTPNAVDCSGPGNPGVPNPWYNQQPYDPRYTKEGTSSTLYTATEFGSDCGIGNPGWTMKLTCE